MRSALFLSLLYFTIPLSAQLTETIVSDTRFVKAYTLRSEAEHQRYFLRNNRPIGKWIVYYDSSKRTKALEAEYFEKNEDLYNETQWDRKGKVIYERKINPKHDTLLEKYWFKNGEVKDHYVCIWNPNGPGWAMISHNEYYENGQIVRTPIDYKSLEKQHITVFHENGKKKMEFNWVNGTIVDDLIEYHDNGKTRIKGQYAYPKDMDPTLAPNTRPSREDGKWSYYNEKGKLIKEEFYKFGELISTTEKK